MDKTEHKNSDQKTDKPMDDAARKAGMTKDHDNANAQQKQGMDKSHDKSGDKSHDGEKSHDGDKSPSKPQHGAS